ncbi:Fur family transcriptional regulator [Ktedonobacter racemifer]|uniref:Ferric uptake regulator, Fur family n=1 Tax=Ktedonobacter racemifer DSM 44963 TaxID=485913 RepID=D6U1U4_KTERA|nr:Fur family transcriptional regulator [Ktedonobacter racemifer]EFH80828.1 ferric uptake regulator, Fur family [Ktedonobacter racemifer DSM 44963]
MLAKNIQTAFDRAGQRITRPRRLIADRLAELAASGTDFSIDNLWQDLRQQDPHFGRATLYRSIEVLVNQGLLDRIAYADGTHRYHVCHDNTHYHLTCVQCRRFVEVDLDVSVEQFVSACHQTDFSLEGLTLTLFGRCAQCRSQAYPSSQLEACSPGEPPEEMREDAPRRKDRS